MKAEADSQSISYYLNNYQENKREFIFSSEDELQKVEWSGDENYLIASLKGAKQEEAEIDTGSSKLIIIDTKQNTTVIEIENNGAVNFIVHGDLVIFDSWIQRESQIILYNYKRKEIFDTLSVTGGSGISYLKSEHIGI